ncbi:MAG: phosphoribosylaminoimidazolesuccinocarboxamide synthase [Oscillospiraceae bacterium]|nr:phosphoribosylaminoimidazolesuccinocarboxamide synthase [Oscillospiraceae bacterium]
MIKIFTGKTKDVFQLEDGNIKLVFKDDMTGADGVFDPGANTVGLTVEGAGLAGLNMSVFYFKLLEEKDYPTHFISAEENIMTVKQAAPFTGGLEVICRYKAMGSFIRRYGGLIKEGAALNAVVEMTLKDDARGDPLINEDVLVAVGILKPGEYEKIKTLTQKICEVIKNDIAEKGMELCDIKLEFGKDKHGNIILIDEISGGNMRVLENGIPVSPLDLSKKLSGF